MRNGVAAENGIRAKKETVSCKQTPQRQRESLTNLFHGRLLHAETSLLTLLCKDTKSRDMRKLKIEN